MLPLCYHLNRCFLYFIEKKISLANVQKLFHYNKLNCSVARFGKRENNYPLNSMTQICCTGTLSIGSKYFAHFPLPIKYLRVKQNGWEWVNRNMCIVHLPKNDVYILYLLYIKCMKINKCQVGWQIDYICQNLDFLQFPEYHNKFPFLKH